MENKISFFNRKNFNGERDTYQFEENLKLLGYKIRLYQKWRFLMKIDFYLIQWCNLCIIFG